MSKEINDNIANIKYISEMKDMATLLFVVKNVNCQDLGTFLFIH